MLKVGPEVQPITERDMEHIEKYIEIENEKRAAMRKALHNLDVDTFMARSFDFANRRITSRYYALASMHKLRVNKNYRKIFTEGQRRLSKRWLKEHNLSEDLNFDEIPQDDFVGLLVDADT